jgi:protocatechuate 3,4-dioxygenase beta subunit
MHHPHDQTTADDPRLAESNHAASGITRRRAIGGLIGISLGGLLAACGSQSDSSAPTTSTPTTATSSSASDATSTTSADSASASTVASSVTAATTSCVLMAEQEQGPFYYEHSHVRSDVTDGKDGVPLLLKITVVDATSCQPLPAAAVDVWMADALGTYSDTSTGLFLRGIQLTGDDGLAAFTTIYPGWYPGRTNHVHLKVHEDGTATDTYSAGHVSHTGNLFFPEDTSVAVSKIAPYTSNTAQRITLTADGVYSRQNGSGSVMTLTPNNAEDISQGFVATITVGVNPAATPALIGIAGTVD